MKTGTKTALSLLFTIVIFVGIAVAGSLGFLAQIENSVYEPARVNVIQKKLNAVAECSNGYITKLLTFTGPDTSEENSGYLYDESVLTLLQKEPSESALRAYDVLCANVPALEGMRVVDSAGKRLHYSTFKGDSRKEGNNRVYSNYSVLKTPSNREELDYSIVTAFPEGTEKVKSGQYRIIFDGEEQRFILSYPVFYKNVGYSYLFYFNIYELTNTLVEQHIISLSEKLTLVSSLNGQTGGFVFGMPKVGQKLLASEVLKRWESNSLLPEEIVVSQNAVTLSGITVGKESDGTMKEPEETVSWNLISAQAEGPFHVSGVYPLELLVMPVYVRILLLVCAFITVYLFFLILFSLKKDDDVVIRNKLKKVQLSLLNDYFEKDYSKKKVAGLIEKQKDQLSAKVKKSLGHRGRKYKKQLDFMLEQSWQDIINVLRGSEGVSNGLSTDDMAEIRRMFEEIVSSGKLKVQAVGITPSDSAPASTPKVPVVSAPAVSQQKMQEVDELEEVEPVEELDEVEPVEDLEEVEEISEAEELEEVEPVEELDEAEPIEDLEEVEEISEAEELEEVEPVEELDEVEELEELEEIFEQESSAAREIQLQCENNEESLNSTEDLLSDDDNHSTEHENYGFEGTEPLVLGDAQVSVSMEEEDPFVGDDFFISQPGDYLFLEEFKEEKIEENKVGIIEEEKPAVDQALILQEKVEAVHRDLVQFETKEIEPVPEEPVYQLEPLSSEDIFMFTTFAANEMTVTELAPEAIEMSEDGVFHIIDNLKVVGMPIDEEFKKLVDSVMR